MRKRSMRRYVVLILVGWAARASGEGPGAAPQTPSSPRALPPGVRRPVFNCLDNPFDFGIVWAGKRIEHRFHIRNDGNEPLQILETKPACSCTLVGDYPRVIEPGQTAEFPAVLDTTKKRNKVEVALAITTNEPGLEARRQLTLTGTVRTVARLDPIGTNFFNNVKPDQPERRELRLVNTSGQPLKLELVPLAATSPFRAELVEKKPGEEFVVVVTAAGPFQDGNTDEMLAFKTNVPEVPQYHLDLHAFRAPRIQINPPYMAVDGNQRQDQHRKLYIINHGAPPFEIVTVAATNGLFAPKFIGKKDNRFEFEVTIPAYYRPSSNREYVAVQTTDPEKKVIQVRVVPTGRPPPENLIPPEYRDNALGRKLPPVRVQVAATTTRPSA